MLAVLLIIWKLPTNIVDHDSDPPKRSMADGLKRVDWAGFTLLPLSLTVAFLALDQAGKFSPPHFTVPLGVCAAILLGVFCYVEKYHAQEPIIPMTLLVRRDVYIPYLLVALQTAAQFIVSEIRGSQGSVLNTALRSLTPFRYTSQ